MLLQNLEVRLVAPVMPRADRCLYGQIDGDLCAVGEREMYLAAVWWIVVYSQAADYFIYGFRKFEKRSVHGVLQGISNAPSGTE